jgi:membrane AbrB-like protein
LTQGRAPGIDFPAPAILRPVSAALMSLSPSRPELARRFAETMAYGVAGGAVLGLAGLPAGWLSGAIVGVSVAALAGRQVFVPAPVGRIVYVLLGISLGSAVTPQTVATMVTWPLSMLALTVAMVSVTLSVMAYLKFVHGWDTLSALFASAPGALAQAMALAQDTGADVRSIAMVQTVRLFVLAVALPIAFAAFGVAGLPPPQGADAPLLRSIVELAVLVLASAGAGWFAYRFRIPGGLIVGAMAASGVLHGAGLVHAFLPVPVAIASFVVMGAMIGTRLGGADIRMLARLSLVGIGALTVGTTVGVLCAAAVAFALNLRLADVVMAYAPGAIEAMTIIAFALHLDPVFVGVHHLARFTFMSMVLPAATGLIRKYEGRGKNDEQQAPPSS